MSKTFLTLIILLSICISALIYIRLNFPIIQNVENNKSVTFKSNTSLENINLNLSPKTLTTSASQSAQFQLELESINNITTSLVQLELSYNPDLIIDIKITPGNYFQNPAVTLNKNDVKNGRYSYAIEGDSTPNPESVVAFIKFETVPVIEATTTELIFLPKTAVLNTKGINILNNAYGAEIEILPALFFHTDSYSDLQIDT